MRERSWSEVADVILAELYRDDRTPTRIELRDACPLGVRKYWPYKVWCRRMQAWKAARAMGLARPPEHFKRVPARAIVKVDPLQLDIEQEAARVATVSRTPDGAARPPRRGRHKKRP